MYDNLLDQFCKECTVCGKHFIIQTKELYTYRIGTLFFCCYTHYRSYKRRKKQCIQKKK